MEMGPAGREAEEDHVAGHVGRQRVAQGQVVERVHQPGHHREANQEPWQRSLRSFVARAD